LVAVHQQNTNFLPANGAINPLIVLEFPITNDTEGAELVVAEGRTRHFRSTEAYRAERGGGGGGGDR